MKLIDTHCHLDFPDFENDLEAILENAREQGVGEMITIATDVESSRKAIALAEKHPGLYATVGVHPCEAMKASETFCDELEALVSHPKVVAIGECGLDYYWLPGKQRQPHADAGKALQAQDASVLELEMADQEIMNRQAIVFQQQLDLAASCGLNVVVHQRESWDACIRAITPYKGKLRCVFHCFGGSPEEAAALKADNHMVSFTGIVTFKNAEQVRLCAQAVTEDSFMVETDAPYLAPVPHRGKRCEPAHTRLTAEKIAEVRGVSLESIAEATTRNARNFFRFPAD